MKFAVLFVGLAGCAQPAGDSSSSGGLRFDMAGRHLQLEDDGGDQPFGGSHDLATAARDFATAGSTVDMARASGAVDMANTVGPGDMALPCASVENCFNDIDDDCNGTINDGCPDTISVGADHVLTAVGGSGGGPTSIHCPANQIAIGIRVYYYDGGGYLSGMGIACSPVTLVRGATSYSVQLTNPTQVAGEFYGGDTDYGPEDDPCDTTQFQTPWTHIIDPHSPSSGGTFVDGLVVDCGQGALTLSATNQLTISFSELNNQYGWEYRTRSGTKQLCGFNEGLVGYNAHYGAYLDNLQPICAPLVVNYK